ncbi:MAG: NAD-dependent epimerase/dehydratase family protein [Balneolia bacterium]|nr:NAD-dependent epimerase/dehydratase family protein [Balneolia bacterium]
MTKILISGLSGFAGSNLYSYLTKQGKSEISGVSRDKKKLAEKISGISETVNYDDLFGSSTSRYEAYIHLAGKAHDLKGISDESEYFQVNYELTQKLYDRFLKDESAKTFIFVSSVKAAADFTEGELTEDVSPAPVTAYGKSKLKAEQYILDNLPDDRTVVILRPCMIHGPGNKGNLNLLHSIVKRGIPWPLGSFDNQRSFLSIANFCFVISMVLEGKVKSGVYNIADNEPVSTRELVSIIAEVNSKKPRIWNVPKPLIQAVAKTGNILPLPLNEERLEKLTENFVVSNKKLISALGQPLPVSARDGLIKTIESFNKES